jgi:hypothetical protein
VRRHLAGRVAGPTRLGVTKVPQGCCKLADLPLQRENFQVLAGNDVVEVLVQFILEGRLALQFINALLQR